MVEKAYKKSIKNKCNFLVVAVLVFAMFFSGIPFVDFNDGELSLGQKINTAYAATSTFSTATTSASFVVPAGVTSLDVSAWGAGGGGGAGGGDATASDGGAGGGGGFVGGTIAVTPGETLTYYVGGGGGYGDWAINDGGGSAGGGGYTGLFRGSDPLFVAGGGGGGGGGSQAAAELGGDGGAGGGATGVTGETEGNGNGGAGGTQSAGGAGGADTGDNAGGDGASLTGGAGAVSANTGAGAAGAAGLNGGGAGAIGSSAERSTGGGGGAGYYGGGGGSSSGVGGGGGGGGSSYATSTATATTTTAGSGTSAGNNADSLYAGSAGLGGSAGISGSSEGNGGDGNDGLLVIEYSESAGENVWNATDWTLYDTITIDSSNIDDDLTDFPVYVDLSDMSATFWSTTPASSSLVGTDIRVTTDDGSPTELPRELVSASSTAQTGELHFRADSISSTTDTVFRIYYNGTTTGDYAITDTYGAENVWTNDFVMVHHLNEGASTASDFYLDSTANDHDGTLVDANSNTTEKVSAKVGNAVDFNGDADTIDIDSLGGSVVPHTGNVSVWVNRDATTGQTRLLGIDDAFEYRITPTTGLVSYEFFYGSSGAPLSTGDILSTATWYHLSTNYVDSGAITGYIDGQQDGSGTSNGTDPSAGAFSLGSRYSTKADYVDGSLDEIRVSSSTRSAAWIDAEYTNQSTTTDFYTVAAGVVKEVSGTVYEQDGVTPITTGLTVSMALGTSTPTVLSTTSDGSGNYSFVLPELETGGESWTARTASGDNDALRDVVYGNGMFVAVGLNSGDPVLTSLDGVTWTARSAAGNNDGWTSVTYGNGLFVAVGYTGDRVMTSPDGINWTAHSAAGDNDSWYGVTYGDGLFVAVGSSGGDRVMTSPDGINWTARSAVDNDDGWSGVTYGDGLFVAVGYLDDRVMTSPDGINWTARSAVGNDDDWIDVAYANGLFVAVGYSGDYVMTSPDGINWTARSAAGNDDGWYGVTYANGLFVAVGYSGDRVMTSPDGINWTARTAAGDNDSWFSVTYGNGKFVAVGASGGDRVMTADGGFGDSTPITLYLDGETEKASTIIYGPSADDESFTNIDLYEDTLRADLSNVVGSVSFANADFYDREDDSDVVFVATTSTTTVNANLVIATGTTLVAPQHLVLDGDYTNNGTYSAERGRLVAHSRAYDVSELNFHSSNDVSAVNHLGIGFSPDGLDLYLLNSNEEINHYSLSSPYDITDLTFENATDTSAYSTNPRGVFLKPDGTAFYMAAADSNEIQQFSMSTPWDVSTADYVAATATPTVSDDPYGVSISPDGVNMLVVIRDTPNTVFQYELSTPWDVTTADYVQNSIAIDGLTSQGLYVSSDGKKAIVASQFNGNLRQYSMSTPWDVSTMSEETDIFGHLSGDDFYTMGASHDGKNIFLSPIVDDVINRYVLDEEQEFSGSMTGESAFYELVNKSELGLTLTDDVKTLATTTIVDTATTTYFGGGNNFEFNSIDWQGEASSTLPLRSDTDGVQWDLDVPVSVTVGYLDVKDSNNISATNTPIDCLATCVNSGNNDGWSLPATGGIINQEGFVFREDDGSESTALPIEAQDTSIYRNVGEEFRLRVLLNNTGESVASDYSLQYKLSSSSEWFGVAQDNMAFPVVEATSTGAETSNTTSHSISMPSGITAGDLLLILFSSDGGENVYIDDSTWQRYAINHGGTQLTNVAYWKFAEGSDSATITTGSSEMSSHIVYRISGAATPMFYATSSTDNSANTNPPLLNTDASRSYLWIAGASIDGDENSASAPSGYSGLIESSSNSGASGVTTLSSAKTLLSASENPGAYTTASAKNIPFTIAVPPENTLETGEVAMVAGDAPTGTNESSYGTLAWNAVGSITDNDGSSANKALSGTAATQYLVADNWGFNIPSEATITGVEVGVERIDSSGSTGNIVDSSVRLFKSGSVVGSNLAKPDQWNGSWTYVNYGSSTALWGTTITPDEVNGAGFGVGFSMEGTTAGTNKVGNVDHITLNVYYTLPGSIDLYDSTNISASGDNTTAYMTPPSGKDTGDFTTGRIQDDENPTDSVTVDGGEYTELEWSLIPTNATAVDEVYQFRVVAGTSTALGSYAVTPQVTIGEAAVSTVGQVDYMVRKNSSDTTAASVTETTFGWDTEVATSTDSDIAYNSGSDDFTLQTGKYLVMYSQGWDTDDDTDNERKEIQGRLEVNSTTIVPGASQCYIRQIALAQDDCITAGSAILDITAESTLATNFYRTDSATVGNPARENTDGYNGMQIIKLDDEWNYARYSISGTQAANTSAVSFADVSWDNDDEEDTGFSRSGANITISNAGRYLVTYSLPIQKSTAANTRTEYVSRLTLDDTEVEGTRVSTYMRGNESTNDGVLSYIGIIDVADGDVLTVEDIKHDGENSSYQGGAIEILQLPSEAKTFIREATSGDMNPTTETEFSWDTTAHNDSDTFTINSATDSYTEVVESGDYVFFWAMAATDATITRSYTMSRLSVNDDADSYWSAVSRFSRDSGNAHNPGYSTGLFAPGLLAGDDVSVEVSADATTGSITLDNGAFSGLRLDTLFADNTTFSVGDSTAGQVSNAFSLGNKTAEPAFTFKLNGTTTLEVDRLTIDVTGIKGLEAGEISAVKLYKDINSDGDLDGGDKRVGGNGLVVLGDSSGSISFLSNFSATSSEDYLVVFDTNSIDSRDSATFRLYPNGVEMVSGAVGSGVVSSVQHYRGSQGGGGGASSQIGGGAPEGDGDVGGGGSGGGDEAGKVFDSGFIEDDVNFYKPTDQTGSFINGGEMLESQGSYAYTFSSGQTHDFTDYNFNIPDGNEIVGIEVKVNGYYTSSPGSISLELSWNNDSNYTDAKTTPNLTDELAVYTLGGPADDWGHSWTPSELSNANFISRITMNQGFLYLDAIQVRVYHQASGGGSGGGGGAI